MLMLGNFLFAEFEIPERITGLLGGKQMLAVKKQIGGQRVIDAMGVDPADIAWSGRFQGGDLVSRAGQISVMRDAGQPVTLVCDTIVLTVAILEFNVSYERPWQGTYDIKLVVQPDQAQDDASSLDDLVGDDLTSAQAIIATNNVSSGAAGL